MGFVISCILYEKFSIFLQRKQQRRVQMGLFFHYLNDFLFLELNNYPHLMQDIHDLFKTIDVYSVRKNIDKHKLQSSPSQRQCITIMRDHLHETIFIISYENLRQLMILDIHGYCSGGLTQYHMFKKMFKNRMFISYSIVKSIHYYRIQFWLL